MLSREKLLPEPIKDLKENPFLDSCVIEFLNLPSNFKEADELLLNEAAMEVIEGWSEKLAQAMWQRKGSMPLYRMFNYMRGEFKEEDVKELNQRLTMVEKQKIH